MFLLGTFLFSNLVYFLKLKPVIVYSKINLVNSKAKLNIWKLSGHLFLVILNKFKALWNPHLEFKHRFSGKFCVLINCKIFATASKLLFLFN